MNIKTILLFTSGLFLGGAAGVFGTMKYFQNKYQKQYEDDHAALEEYYHRTDEYSRGSHDEDEEEYEDDGINSVESDSRPGGRMSDEERAEIKKKLNKNWEGTTNYAGMYKHKDVESRDTSMYDGIVKTIDATHPLDQGEGGELDPNTPACLYCANYDSGQGICQITDEEVNIDDGCSDFELPATESAEEQVFDEHQKNKNKPPKIISADAYAGLPAHIDQEVLYFYAYDEVLCDDNEEYVEEPERLIGDALTKYDFVDSDERIIFVMNYALDTCYEIQKVDASWSETH